MSARKLGRLAGLVFVLAVVFGGVVAAGLHGQSHTSAVDDFTSLSLEWD